MSEITNDTIFDHTSCVVVRPQKENYLFYNSKTDELHLIPPTGHTIYELCDGLRSVEDIWDHVSDAVEGGSSTWREALKEFLRELENRGLVERADG